MGGYPARERRQVVARGEIIAGLDIGTTKTCAVVAAAGPDGLEIIGIGEAPSTGMRKGVVTDLEETVKAIEAATEKAERMAGVHISHVYVGVTGEHIASTNNRGVVSVSGDEREVVSADVRRVVDASKIINLAADRQIIHALPRHFTIDGQDGVTDPVGMSGGRLEVDTHIITGGSTFIANVLKCVHRAGLEPAGIVFQPLASSSATLLSEEKHVGCILLDIGGGTTDIAVYADGGVIIRRRFRSAEIFSPTISRWLEDDVRRSGKHQAHVRLGARKARRSRSNVPRQIARRPHDA